MAFGDIGGLTSQLLITCQASTPTKKGDPLVLVGPYVVSNEPAPPCPIFGFALDDAEPDQAIPVFVRGTIRVRIDGARPDFIDGMQGIVMHENKGFCRVTYNDLSVGTVLMFWPLTNEADVLL